MLIGILLIIITTVFFIYHSDLYMFFNFIKAYINYRTSKTHNVKHDTAILKCRSGQTVHIMFCHENSFNMIGVKVYHIDKEDIKKDITHTPGIPYHISAKSLGGGKIVAVKDDQEIVYTGSEIVGFPEFSDDMLDEE